LQTSNWINLANNNFSSLTLLIDKQNKLAKTIKNKNVLFYKYSNGINTARDEWVYDFNKVQLKYKINYFFKEYNSVVKEWKKHVKTLNILQISDEELMKKASDFVFSKEFSIKWSGRLFRDKLLKSRTDKFKHECVKKCLYRPFTKKNLYTDYIPIDLIGQFDIILPNSKSENKIITISSQTKGLQVLASDILVGFDFLSKTVCIPLYRYDNSGKRLDNLTDWGLKLFTEHYKDETINKEDIFYYTYAVLHNPAYSKKYELNLNREFPKIPFYNDFRKWSEWGKELMNLHIGYESAELYGINIHEVEKPKEKPKLKLKAVPESGEINLDENTSISGIPNLAWKYKFGNRSALHWIIDQYKEKTIEDKTIAEKFNKYKFADFKDTVIDLIKRITTVSVKTMEIVNQMELEEPHND